MGTVSFSSSLSFARLGMPGLSMALAPVQALVAFFMPVQSGQTSYRRPVDSYLPRPSRVPSNLAHSLAGRAVESTTNRPISRLKVIREFEPGANHSQTGRMVISGRMADVCAELDRISQRETLRR